ncbi:MAG: type IV toxin-antitoxin system AbiEi family antitoxin [Pseudomonadota bacterium]|nr:type IV toxin-antitoxin system AbiEi family antitoxin [Pseudomonadota bacterium]
MKAQEFITHLRAQGRYSFNTLDAQTSLELNMPATLNALKRLKGKGYIVSPAKSFYNIVPPEYQALGCLPAEMFVHELMKHLNLPYYIGFLSAAQYYGAAHQKPQRFQVVTTKNRPAIHCGRIYIEFIANKNASNMPINKFNTPAGTINVATPELIAGDIVTFPRHAGGINNVATILFELAEKIDINKLEALSKLIPKIFWLQRLGYLFEFLEITELANGIEKIITGKKHNWILLVSYMPYNPIIRIKKWRIIVNTDVEIDE